MLFNEIYSAYYNAVARIISSLIDGKTDEKELNGKVREYAFAESVLTVIPSLKNERWQLMKPDMTTEIKHKPVMPLTNIQMQWLKALSLDPRIKLFDIDFSFLGDTEPLFTPDDFVIYDKFSDGDDFENEKYIAHFRTILSALRNRQHLKIEMLNKKGETVSKRFMPSMLEYSEKDDKFRLVISGGSYMKTVNLARIKECCVCDSNEALSSQPYEAEYKTLTLKVSEERNTPERCMLHFAHFEKSAEKKEGHLVLNIKYPAADESEMVIRVLSFGPLVEAVSPESFRNLIITKLKNQKSCELF